MILDNLAQTQSSYSHIKLQAHGQHAEIQQQLTKMLEKKNENTVYITITTASQVMNKSEVTSPNFSISGQKNST